MNPATPQLPTEAQISQTIAFIKRRFNHPNMAKPINRSVKEGYTEAIRILAEGITDPRLIDGPTTVQGRAIADMAIDYLKGGRSQHVLINVPLKA
ncbi:hypothetical protein [Fibrella forsythiae]|uniref:Uncharacterized protein n=1 Tax=Fibrella forsythiae TaxID=2817061 RepID=A0ABS3JCY5_9BACT|nr:hypothetical protein [Fibrella forsythiae]MBO0947308.1 hypothetical protein [Fibrella forsythiae]